MIDVFRVGVHLGMTSNAPQMLGVIAQHFGHLHIKAQELERQFGRVAVAAGGAVAALAGVGIVKGVWHAIEASKELNAELNRTAQLGGKLKIDPASLRAQAYDAANQVRTMNPAEAVRMEREIAGQVGTHEKAFKILPTAGRLAWNLQEFTGADSETAIKDTVKAADLWGHIFSNKGPNGEEEVDVDKMNDAMDYMAKGVKSSGGMLKPSDYLAFMKHAGLSGKSMDPKAFFGWATEAMVAMGAPRAGTASSSLFQQMQAGTAPAHDWRTLAAMSGGVFKEGRDFNVEKGGHTSITAHGRSALKLDQEKVNPFIWINDVLIPMLEKGGVKKEDMLSKLTEILGRQTTQRLVGEAYQNHVQFARTAELFDHAMGVEASSGMLHDKDLDTNLRELTKAWEGFMQALGEPGIPLAIDILHWLTERIHRFTTYLADPANAEAVKHLLEYTAAFGGLLILGGSMAVMGAALRPFTSALGLLLRATTGIPSAAAGLSSIGGALLSLLGIIARVAGPVGAFLTVMSPTALNGNEDAELARIKALPADQQRALLKPRTDTPAASPGLLDNVLDRFGVHRLAGATHGSAMPPSPSQLSMPTGSDGQPISTMPGVPGAPIVIQSTLRVGEREMASVVNRINMRDATRANSGGTGFNPRISAPSPVGAY